MFKHVEILILTFLAALTTHAYGAETGFLTKEVQVDGTTYLYQVFVPKQWTADEKWPVIFFLHGAGERGSDGVQQTKEGLPEILRSQLDFPAIVVMPQCARGTWWGESAMEKQAFAALEQSMQSFNGDPNRLYLTGLSMGGYGTWAFGYKYPDKFAALVPVCGGVTTRRTRLVAPEWHPSSKAPENPYRETATGIGKVPVWAFHGDMDRSVPVAESRNLTEALKASGGNVRYTEYPGVPHNSWDRAYAESELIPWLLSQKKGAP